ncbi:ThiF family adenylyltransferase [Photobacterium aphoticum]|uniref:Molybdopterin-synthase adenylyltransferase n=1 Tax=Photobacterium aphoticum TaxID=754436 RepID=A0A0J1GPG4_9GAMM|nr:HesA/MoeB/ThiF family protein [Photobacterium aphoticum]KLV01521.1 molybdopterin-synthase adenylyltransferase [Photobacterium aphoticum]GHA43129.1 thiazole biosynthesis adenylyltransferase ThiF [Photobacterium aphoticum]
MISDQAFLRYSRQIMLPEIGEQGQTDLANAQVLIVGAGGLGSAAALYLAGAGVGQVVIADDDRLEVSNLPRQVLYREADIGQPKAVQAAAQLQALNPLVRVRAANARLAGERLALEVAQADVVLDCSDNLATRHAVSQACYRARKPLIAGAAIRWHGQLMAFDFRQGKGPCYHCLFPLPDASSSAGPQNCSTGGVAGPVVGNIGTLQALEALKVLTGAGSVAFSRLQNFDGLTLQWQSFHFTQDTSCPVCGPSVSQQEQC